MEKLYTAEQKQFKRSDLEELFGTQVATLNNRGVPEQISQALQSQKNAVVQKSNGMTISEGNIPFLPVIKPAYMGYCGLMAMVRNGFQKGCVYLLKPDAVKDQFETPDDLYYIYDVEDGNATCGESPQGAEKIFKKQSRSPLTAAEVVNLCILTDVLSRHYVWAAGSFCESVAMVPCVCLGGGGRPGLGWGFVGCSGGHWGSASCGSR